MPRMFVTAAVFQLPISWLNAAAPWNISSMLLTVLVSHLLMSWLNEVASLNKELMSVTPDVHDLASSASFQAPTRLRRPSRSRFVYVTPLTQPTSS